MSQQSIIKRRPGRPRKGEPPRLPYEDLDRILVHGELVQCADGENTTVQYPTYRELAERFNCSHSLIAAYSRRHDCMRRREQARARVAAQADQKLVELRASAVALSRDDELRIIDSYLAGFELALAEGKVRFDNPGDFNTMVRLKAFVQGGADSRSEIHGVLSLQALQDRHRSMMRAASATPAERGAVAGPPALLGQDGHALAPDDHDEAEALADNGYDGSDGSALATEGYHDEDDAPAPVSDHEGDAHEVEVPYESHERDALPVTVGAYARAGEDYSGDELP